jgi:2-C-methyl-D-erythritol 4-phosphate cytidylyltransferase
MAVALVVAAGRGERLEVAGPKALVSLAGKPLVEWSVLALRAVPRVDQIVVALPPEDLDAAPAEAIAVAGGEVRSQSVLNALRASGEGDPILVHDAARPLATPELFGRALDELERSDVDAVIAATRVSDTIKELDADGQTVHRTLDRSRLWAVQTPQVFRRPVLERALGGASRELLSAATDDAWLVEQIGGTVRVVDGGPNNIKVTTATDLRLAELLLAARTADQHRRQSDRLAAGQPRSGKPYTNLS